MLKRFFNLSGSPLLFSNFNGNNLSYDFTKYYSFNTPLQKVCESDICVLVDINLRISLPLLNSRLRQLSSKKMVPVFVLGFYSNYNYFVKHIGNGNFSAMSVVEGTHWLSSKISKKFSLKPLLFVSSISSFLTNSFVLHLLKHTNLFSQT
jgi:hypothetical protein